MAGEGSGLAAPASSYLPGRPWPPPRIFFARPQHNLTLARHRPSMFIAVWEFEVPAATRAAFEALYGPSGEWVVLFRSAPAYLGSELFCDPEHAGRYLTVDRWTSAEAYRAFKQRQAGAYAALDARGDSLTATERLLGEFELVAR